MFSIGKFVRNLKTRIEAWCLPIIALACARSPAFARFAFNHAGVSPVALVGTAIGVLMLGILLPIGLSAWQTFTPTNATLLVIWPIGAVLIVLGIVLSFYRDQNSG